MPSREIRGVCPIIATPFTDDGDVDYSSLRNQVQVLAEGGADAGTLFGLASEFYKLADSEQRKMIDVTIDEAEEYELPIIVSVTHQATEIAVENARYADEAGADCIMILPPFMRGITKGGIYEHVRSIAEAVSVPVMIQYAPSKTNVTIPPSTFVKMSQNVDNIEYFKIECQPPGPYISELKEKGGDDAKILVGHAGFQMLEALDRGATGVMPAASLFELYIDVYEAYISDNRQKAIQLHNDLLPILNHTIQLGVLYEKEILAKRGIIESDYCRKPLRQSDEHYQDLFEEYYSEIQAQID